MEIKIENKKESLMIFSIVAIMCLGVIAFLPTATAATINVPADYPSIQTAINNANPGDTIQVATGTYYENQITVDKSLNINGEDKTTTIIDAGGNNNGFYVTTDTIEISGFNIINFTSHGVNLQDGSNSKISDNIFDPGISAITAVQAFSSVSNVEVTNNEMYRVGVAAYTGSCDNWNISNNIIDMQNEAHMGICGGGSDYVIKNNEIKNCGDFSDSGTHQAIDTYQFGSATNWVIKYNDIYDNEDGIQIEGTGHQVHFNNIYNNAYIGVTCDNTIDATCNWWGDISGPNDQGPGSGDNVSVNVMFSPWLGFEFDTTPMTYIVDDVGPEPTEGYIQTAVNCADGGDTIKVHDGNYDEQVGGDTYDGEEISEPLTIISNNKHGATVNSFNVKSEDVIIDGFTIDGPGTWGSNNIGVLIQNNPGGVTVTNCDISTQNAIMAINSNPSEGASDIEVTNNTIHDTTGGVIFYDVENSMVSNNSFDTVDVGIQITVYSGPLPDDNFIEYNDFTNINGEAIYIQAKNTSIQFNDIDVTSSGYGVVFVYKIDGMASYESEMVGNEVHYNNLLGGKYGVAIGYQTGLNPGVFHIDNDSTIDIDASCNWWNDISGPSGKGSGSGVGVSDDIIYCPWLNDIYPAGDCIGGAVCWNTDTGEYFCSIQAAIDDGDTLDGHTIEIFTGINVEQVNIYKSLTLYGQGIGNTIIQSPDILTDYFTTSNDNYPIVYIHDVDDVVIKNLTVDGAGKGNSNYRFIGIAMYQAGATLKDLEVLNVQDTPFSGMQHGTGIYAWADGTGISHDVIVQDCVVEDFQKNGITLSGSDLNVEVTGSTVQGKGPTDVTAQNGIQVSHGASGTITENTVSGCSYIGDVWAASGILPYFADGVLEISDNVITENQANIYLGACSADITDNTITATAAGTQQDYFYGIIGDPGDPPIIPDASPFDDGTPPVDRTTYEITCTGNDVIGDGSSSSTGIGVYAGMYGTYDIEFTATNNNVKDWGFGFELYAYGSNDLIFADINYNNIVGNQYGIYNWLTTTYDATCNWWGDINGPTHTSNPAGSGDEVTDYVEYLPWLNLPFDDPNSECGAGLCQDIVHIDDDYTTSTPGWYIDHFPNIQIALDRLSTGGTAIIHDGIYEEDLIIDDDNCDNTGITIKGAYECFPTDEAAVIGGNILISVDDVTIKYLEFKPNTDAAITVEPLISGITLECNKFRKDCVTDAVGVDNLGCSMIDAELNWWGRPDGPSGGKMDDGKTADGRGVEVDGNVDVEPWIGIHAEVAKPNSETIEINVGNTVSFDATGSFAYSFGECCQLTPINMQYLWDFGDGTQSSNKKATHLFDKAGTYEVSLMVDSYGIPGLYGNLMYDWGYVTVHVTTPDTPLTVSADGENLGGYETTVGEPVQLYGDAYGGDSEYIWSWNLGDGTQSSKQNPVHIYDEPGIYTVELTVVSGGETASDTAEVEVHDIDELLVDLSDGNAVCGKEVMFSASISGGVKPYTYSWSFGDGTTSNKQQPGHVYEESGEYKVSVTVTDDNGQSNTDTALVTVEEQNVEELQITEVSSKLAGVKATISTGDSPAVCSITVDGRVWLGGETINVDLPAGVTETIETSFTFGFGKVDITVNAGSLSEEYTAFLIGPIFLNLQEK